MKNHYEINGDTTIIFLRRNNGDILKTYIDTSDLEKVQRFPNTWLSHWDRNRQKFYCDGKLPRNGKEAKRVSLHRYILEPPSNLVVDHINHDPLDNRRCNLRILTNAQNCQNKNGLNKNNKTGVRGVSWNSNLQCWRVSIRKNYKYVYQNNFKNYDDAVLAAKNAISTHLKYAEE